MSGESWQDQISSGIIDNNKDDPAAGSTNITKKSGDDWQDRIGSGVKKEVDSPTITSKLNKEQQQDLQTLKLAMSEHQKWLAKKKGGKQADFSKKTYEGQNLAGWHLAKTLMAGTNLAGSSLKGADLSEADMFGATLRDVDLQDANLEGAVLRGVSLKGANLTNANLKDADLRGGVMMGADGGASIGSERSDLTACLMDYAQGTRAKMSNVDFQGASFCLLYTSPSPRD